jgi:succinoglycan biosynthesis protein ExoA
VTTTILTDTATCTSTCTTIAYLSISIIVPVRNEGRHIESTLRQLLEQEYPGEWEIIVVDGESTDDTAWLVHNIAAKHPRIRLLSNPKRLSSAARNIGIQHARGEVILVVDGHCELNDRKLLENVSSAFGRSGAACLGRPQPLDISAATPMQQAIALARSSRLGHHPNSFIYVDEEHFVPAHSVAVAYRRDVFEKVGYFDEGFDACEDVEFNHRIDKAGLKCFFTPSIQVRYFPRTTVRRLFNQLARYGSGRMRLLKKHPDTFSLGSFLPAIFWLGILLGWLGGFLWYPLWPLYFGILGLYLGTVILVSLQISLSQKQIRLLPLLPVIFVTIHLASATGVVRELFAAIRFHRTASSEST